MPSALRGLLGGLAFVAIGATNAQELAPRVDSPTVPPAQGSSTKGGVGSGWSEGQPERQVGTDSPQTASFSTKYATFTSVRFSDLPGWDQDDLTEAWRAFRESCKVLSSRGAWGGACKRSTTVSYRNTDAIRRFVEKEFSLYQIHNKDLTSSGIITGYYEPLLEGSLKYGGKYLYPVYGVPDDLLYLDSRILATTKGGDVVNATLQGRNVVRNSYSEAPRGAVGKRYVLDVGDAKPDIRDKKFRVRLDGDRIVPYYTRAEIERGALTRAPIIAWVDNAAALYSMQVQGSGKLRLPNGEIVRVAYAEQNGRPFLPPLRKATRGDASSDVYPLIRGMPIDLSEPDAEDDIAATSGSIVDAEARTRGMETPSDAPNRERPVPADGSERNVSPEVARVIDILLQQQRTKSNDTVKGGSRVVPDPKSEYTGTGGRKTSGAEPSRPGRVGDGPLAKLSAFSSDPSYVFFRKIPDSENGPIGALGVPLTAGRSVAVDPRTTPLGYPVFISTERSGSRNRFNRLMFAHDTGGAIRGAVRADYFWGFGARAGELASRMKDDGRMWLLLPKDQPLPAARAGNGTRGTADVEAVEAECVVQDPQLCVE